MLSLVCQEAVLIILRNHLRFEDYRKLLSYYKSNADGLLSAYGRNVPIPDTSEPGVIHHARLGSR